MRIFVRNVTLERGHDDFLSSHSFDGTVVRSRRPPTLNYTIAVTVTHHENGELQHLHEYNVSEYELVSSEDMAAIRAPGRRAREAEAELRAFKEGDVAANPAGAVRMAAVLELARRNKKIAPTVASLVEIMSVALSMYPARDDEALACVESQIMRRALEQARLERETAVSEAAQAAAARAEEQRLADLEDAKKKSGTRLDLLEVD